MRISDWSSDVCSSDLIVAEAARPGASVSDVARRYGIASALLFRWRKELASPTPPATTFLPVTVSDVLDPSAASPSSVSGPIVRRQKNDRSEEHTSELQSLMRISYAVFCLKKKKETLHTMNLTKNNKD